VYNMKQNNLCTINMDVVWFLMAHNYNWDTILTRFFIFQFKLMAEVTGGMIYS